MESGITLPQLLLRNAERTPDRPALREKDRGIWQTYTWRRYCDEVRDFALGLAARGFGRGDKLSVIGENRPRLYFAQLAAMSLGGIAVPVYQDAIASELAYVLAHAETSVIVAEDQEQVDKILALRDELPHLTLLVYDDPRGLRSYDESAAFLVRGCPGSGAAIRRRQPRFLRDRAGRRQTGRSGAVLLYLGHDLAPERGDAVARQSDQRRRRASRAAENIRPDDEHLSYLPMAWIGNSVFSLALHLRVGFTCNFPERPETVTRDLRELGPTLGLGPPRYWENTLTAITVRAADSGMAEALAVPAFPHRRRARPDAARPRGGRSRPACALQRAIGEVLATRRCAISSVCAAPGSSIPAARRSARTRSASSAPSGSI